MVSNCFFPSAPRTVKLLDVCCSRGHHFNRLGLIFADKNCPVPFPNEPISTIWSTIQTISPQMLLLDGFFECTPAGNESIDLEEFTRMIRRMEEEDSDSDSDTSDSDSEVAEETIVPEDATAGQGQGVVRGAGARGRCDRKGPFRGKLKQFCARHATHYVDSPAQFRSAILEWQA